MTTITGNILTASDAPLHVLISFVLQSAPLVGASGKVVASPAVSIKSNAADGSFTVTLESGIYLVTFNSIPQAAFYISVPAGGPFTIDQVLVPKTGTQTPTYAASGSGSPEGVNVGFPGYTYFDTLNGTFYIKATGAGTTGWQPLFQL